MFIYSFFWIIRRVILKTDFLMKFCSENEGDIEICRINKVFVMRFRALKSSIIKMRLVLLYKTKLGGFMTPTEFLLFIWKSSRFPFYFEFAEKFWFVKQILNIIVPWKVALQNFEIFSSIVQIILLILVKGNIKFFYSFLHCKKIIFQIR